MKQYHLTAVIWKEGKYYVSKCPEIGVSSYGATPDKARRALEEAVELDIANAKKIGLAILDQAGLAKDEFLRLL